MKYIEIAVPDDFDRTTHSLADAVNASQGSTGPFPVSRQRLVKALDEFRKDIHAAHGVSMDSDDIDEAALDWPDLAETYKQAVRALRQNDAPAAVFNAVTPVFVREDGQAFSIENYHGRFRSTVPSDLGNERHSFLHDTFKDAHAYLVDLLAREQPGVTLVSVVAVELAGGKNGDLACNWYLDAAAADQAAEWNKKSFPSKEHPAWNIYRFDVPIASRLSNDEILETIEANLRRLCDTVAQKYTTSGPAREQDNSPSP